MLDNTQKKMLRGEAHALSPLIQIGKAGITPTLLENLASDLDSHELVKVSVLKTCPLEVKAAALDCASAMRCDLVQVIGRTFVLYKKNKENRFGL